MTRNTHKLSKTLIRIATKYSHSSLYSSSPSSSSSLIAGRDRVECVVIGAGAVGIGIARELALKGKQVLVIESSPSFGTSTSSRNSQVIHAGIYYPTHSLKASCCVKGRELIYDYCSQHQVPHRQIGKLVVATSPLQIPKLYRLMNLGISNGVQGLRMMEGSEAMRIEPELQCFKALWSPLSGIVDTHSLMMSMLGESENHGAVYCYNTIVTGATLEGNCICVQTCETNAIDSSRPSLILQADLVVNSAGLGAIPLAKRLCSISSHTIPDPYYARGCYFTLSNAKLPPFKHLVYPMPEDGGIGVHVTLGLDGQTKFGPDVEWIDPIEPVSIFLNKFDYRVDVTRAQRFYSEIRKYYPNLKDGSLEPDFAGIRPKLSGPKQSPIDFMIQGEEDHGVPGLVNLLGIESPGLTSCMAIAKHIASKYS